MRNFRLIFLLLFLVIAVGMNTVNSQNESATFNRNRISLGVLDIIYGQIGINYERLYCKGRIGVFVPVNLSYADYNPHDYETFYYSGLGMNYYPAGQRKWKYYQGLEINGGYGKFDHFKDCSDTLQGWIYYYKKKEHIKGIYSRFLVNFGILYAPGKEFSVNFHLGFGVRNAFIDELKKNERFKITACLALNLSCWF